MASKLVTRSFKNVSNINRILNSKIFHAKPSLTPIFNLNKNFSISSYIKQQSNENCK